jgi:hypothetical protein
VIFAKTEALFFFQEGPSPHSENNKKNNSKKSEHALITSVDQSTLFAMSQKGWHPFNGPARLKLQVIYTGDQ